MTIEIIFVISITLIWSSIIYNSFRIINNQREIDKLEKKLNEKLTQLEKLKNLIEKL